MIILGNKYTNFFIIAFLILIYWLLDLNYSIAQITVSTVRVTPSFNHIMVGVYINPGMNMNTNMNVTYRKVGNLQWLSAHPGVKSTNDPY